MTPLPRFYPVLDSAAWVERALKAGARFIQLRMKDTPEVVLREEIQRSLALTRAYEAELVVNDYWELAIELGANWRHVGQEDLDNNKVREVRTARNKLEN